jgi:hypothetical protein
MLPHVRARPLRDAAERREKSGERAHVWWAPLLQLSKKCYNSQTKKTKLNSDCTIKFVSINTSKQDVTCIYLDKVTSGPHSG